MTKPSQRHIGHVQAEKPGGDKPAPEAPAPAARTPIVQDEKARGGMWLALVIWAFIFGLLFVWMLIDWFYFRIWP